MNRLCLPVLFLFLILCGCGRETAVTNTGISAEPDVNALQAESSKQIYPDFNFTYGDFPSRLKDLPSAALEDPAGFLALAGLMLEMPAEYLTLVDKNHLLPANYAPGDKVSLDLFDGINAGRQGLFLDHRAAEAFRSMSEAAARDGIRLIVSSAYRSYEYQRTLFQRYADSDGEEMASRYSARPGSSQHQLGTAVDLGDISNDFAGEPAGRWMAERAGAYGWSLSYPDGMEVLTGYRWESWHWRWIGTNAVMMQNRYFNGVQQHLLEFWNENASRFQEALNGGT